MVTVSPINDIQAVSSSSGGQFANDSLGLADNFEDFLILLTAQLENQDPAAPLDPNQFAQQLIDYANVEQAATTNDKLDQLIELTRNQNTNEAVLTSTSLIGKTIEAEGNIVELIDGQTTFNYSLPEEAVSSFISIKDMEGNTVFSSDGAKSGGKHLFAWNGEGNNGVLNEDGQYVIEISGLDNNNNPVEVSTAIRGEVTAVVSGNGSALVVVGSSEIPVTNIRSVLESSSVNEQAANSDPAAKKGSYTERNHNDNS
ncbi:MAG: flagellar hook assembly protein FlgD [Rickettsiales bacterium]|nr:flagellar hook assembly protein FlgD [Rickettsiales bacterium]